MRTDDEKFAELKTRFDRVLGAAKKIADLPSRISEPEIEAFSRLVVRRGLDRVDDTPGEALARDDITRIAAMYAYSKIAKLEDFVRAYRLDNDDAKVIASIVRQANQFRRLRRNVLRVYSVAVRNRPKRRRRAAGPSERQTNAEAPSSRP